MIALYAAVPSKTLADISEKEIKEDVAIGVIRSILFLPLHFSIVVVAA